MEFAPDKIFTFELANKMLPLVRRVVEDISATYSRLLVHREALEKLRGTSPKGLGKHHFDELQAVKKAMESESTKLVEFVEELEKLGVQLKGPLEGLIDFPAEMNGRIVLLCWKLGETKIDHWHELDAGFSGRQPIETFLENVASVDSIIKV